MMSYHCTTSGRSCSVRLSCLPQAAIQNDKCHFTLYARQPVKLPASRRMENCQHPRDINMNFCIPERNSSSSESNTLHLVQDTAQTIEKTKLQGTYITYQDERLWQDR